MIKEEYDSNDEAVVLFSVAKQLLREDVKGFDVALVGLHGGNEGEEEMKIEPHFKSGADSPDWDPLTDEKRTTTIADLVVTQLRDAATTNLTSVKERFSIAQLERDRVREEMRELVNAVQSCEGVEDEREALVELRCDLEKQLETLEIEFCDCNSDQSAEESRLILQSLRDDHSSSYTSSSSCCFSPLLQKYVEVASELAKCVLEMKGTEHRNREVLDLREKLRGLGESLVWQEMQAKKLMDEMKECESQCERLQTMTGDLVAAMKWGQLESGGLYQPSVSSAPVVLLLFQQYCRQRISFHRSPKKAGLCDFMTADRLRRCGCSAIDLKLAGYAGGELRAGGFSAMELKFGTYSVSEIHEAGYTLDEMREIGISAGELKPIFSLSKLKALGYSVGELMSGEHFAAYSVQELVEGGSSVHEMRESEVPASKLRGVFTAFQLKEAGFCAGQLLSGGYPVKEIHGAGYSLEEMKDLDIPLSAWKANYLTIPQLRYLGFSASKLESEGYSPLAIRQGGYSLQEMRDSGISSAKMKTLGCLAPELKEVGYSAGDLSRGGYTTEEVLEAGYSLQEMKDDNVSIHELQGIGCIRRSCGMNPAEIRSFAL
jgi:ribosomal protein L13E